GAHGRWAGSVAMGFTGGARVVVPKGPYSDFDTGALTVECWLRATVFTDSWFIDPKGDGSNRPPIGIYGNNVLNAVGGTGTSLCTAGNFAAGVWGNAWHHVVAVLTRGASDVVRLYLDGIAGPTVTTLPSAGLSMTSATDALSIGASSNGASPVTGQIAQ